MPKKKEVVEVAASDWALIARVMEILAARPERPEVLMRLGRDCYDAVCRADEFKRIDSDGTVWGHEHATFTYLNRVCKNDD